MKPPTSPGVAAVDPSSPMGFATALRASLLPVLGGILLGTYAGSLVFAAFLQMGDGPPLQRWLHVPLDAFGLSFYAFLAGTPMALLFGLPTFAWLLMRGKLNGWTVTGIALVPVLPVLPFGFSIAGLVVEYALCVAWISYALRLWWARGAAARERRASTG